jgi:CheY-like chemotaxis protein
VEEGIEVLGPVPTVQAALDLLAVTERIDGAVVDVNLRGELAYPVADVLHRRGIPCVFTTGYDASSIARRAPGVPCLEKPLPPQQLLDALFGPRAGARP